MAGIIEEGKTKVALGLGIIGGVLGVVAGLFVMLLGGAGMLLAPEGGGAVAGLGAAAVGLGIAGAVGGAVTEDAPEVAAVVMGVAAIGGFFAATVFWLLPGVLLIAGAVFAWQSRAEHARTAA